MQTVVIVDNRQATVALHAAHGEKMHRLVVHPHQHIDACSLIGFQESTVRRLQGSEARIQHIEEATFGIIFRVGIEAEEARKTHQENQMEVGETLLAFV